MDEGGTDAARRRRRRRATAAQGPAPVAAPSAAPSAGPSPAPDDVVTAPEPTPPVTSRTPETAPKPRRKRPPRDSGQERHLRDLVGSGSSQLGVSGALRARDVDRPTDEDLAEAERDTVIVRRNWQPDPTERRG